MSEARRREATEQTTEELEALGLVEVDEYGVARATPAGVNLGEVRRLLEDSCARGTIKRSGLKDRGA